MRIKSEKENRKNADRLKNCDNRRRRKKDS